MVQSMIIIRLPGLQYQAWNKQDPNPSCGRVNYLQPLRQYFVGGIYSLERKNETFSNVEMIRKCGTMTS